MTDFSIPTQPEPLMMSFPAEVIGDFIPDAADVPPEFWSTSAGPHGWVDWAHAFFAGDEAFIEPELLLADDGEGEEIDGNVAFAHLLVARGSFQPKHEHKIASIAYLASLWFDACVWTQHGKRRWAGVDGEALYNDLAQA